MNDRRRGFMMGGDTYVPESKRLPSGYRLLSYITSTGTQYIQTRAGLASYTRIIGQVDVPASGQTYNYFFRNMGSSSTVQIQLARYNASYLVGWFGGTGQYILCNNNNKRFGLNFDLTVQYSGSDVIVKTKYWNGTTWTVGTSGVTFTSVTMPSSSVFLFAFGKQSAVQSERYKFSLARYQTGSSPSNLTRDMVACDKGSSGEIGMYDFRNKIFYSNSGTGTFTRGSTITSYRGDLLINDI